VGRLRGLHEAADARRERVAIGGHGEARSGGTAGLQLGERAGVGEHVAGGFDGQVVAAQLALDTNLTRYPPDGGMVEKHRFGDALEEVDQVVVAADVREFVDQQRFDVLRGQAGERAQRHHDDGVQPAEHRGDVNALGDDEADTGGDVHTALEAF